MPFLFLDLHSTRIKFWGNGSLAPVFKEQALNDVVNQNQIPTRIDTQPRTVKHRDGMDSIHKMTETERKKANVEKSMRYYEKNKKKVKAKRRVHYQKNKERINAKRRKQYS